MGLGIGAAISGIAGLAGAGIQAGAAGKASREQLLGQQMALQSQQANLQAALGYGSQLYNIGAAGLAPYVSGGQNAYSQLISQLPALTQAPETTQAALENFPGYQFIKQQGLEATQNQYAGQGWGVSGPAMKGAANYATGLASTNFQQLYQDILSGKAQAYNMLSGASGIGAGAAGTQMGASTLTGQGMMSTIGQSAQGQAGAITGGGGAAAAGTLGAANALAGGIGGLGQAALGYGTLNQMISAGMFGANPNAGGGGLGIGNYLSGVLGGWSGTSGVNNATLSQLFPGGAGQISNLAGGAYSPYPDLGS